MFKALQWKCRHYHEQSEEEPLQTKDANVASTLSSPNVERPVLNSFPPSAKSLNGKKYSLGFVTHNNIGLVKTLHDACFPYTFNNRLYSLVLEDRELCRIAYINDIPVGVVCCRLDYYTPTNSHRVSSQGPNNAVDTATLNDSASTALKCTDTVAPKSENDAADKLSEAADESHWEVSTTRTRGPNQRLRLCVLTLAVLEPYRRCGVGRTLMEWVMERSDALRKGQSVSSDSIGSIPGFPKGSVVDIEYVFLHVWTANTPAQAFYKSLGFREATFLPSYYRQLSPSSSIVFTKSFSD